MGQSSTNAEDAKKIGINELLNRLSVGANRLSSSEAKRRLQLYGPNEIPERKADLITKFLG